MAMSTPIYDGTLYTDKPSDPLPGMWPIKVAYSWGGIWPKDADNKADMTDALEQNVRKLAREHTDRLIVLNIEHLPIQRVWSDVSENEKWTNREKIIRIIRWMRDETHGAVRLGLYSTVPVPLGGDISAKRDAIRAEHDSLTHDQDGHAGDGLLDHLDVLFMGGYCRYDMDVEQWIERMDATLSEARRVSQKPVVPFLWPRFMEEHDKQDWRGQPIPKAWWRRMIEWCDADCQGAVIWSRRGPWPLAWWDATQQMMGE